jgi:hypothetical protein
LVKGYPRAVASRTALTKLPLKPDVLDRAWRQRGGRAPYRNRNRHASPGPLRCKPQKGDPSASVSNEFCAEQEDLRGVENPRQQDDQRPRRAEARGDIWSGRYRARSSTCRLRTGRSPRDADRDVAHVTGASGSTFYRGKPYVTAGEQTSLCAACRRRMDPTASGTASLT